MRRSTPTPAASRATISAAATHARGCASQCAAPLKTWRLPARSGNRRDRRSRLLTDDPRSDLRASADAELLPDVLQVSVDRALGQEEFHSDLAVGHALGDKPRDLELARAEASDLIGRSSDTHEVRGY